MSQTFDPALIKSTLLSSNHRTAEVYRLGGGSLGRAYAGLWGYRRLIHGREHAGGADLFLGTPKTHIEAAQPVFNIFDPQEQ